MTAATLAGKALTSGLRPVNLARDLGPIADLIEVCFQKSLDDGGRSAVREMRALSRSGPLVWLLSALTRGSPAWRLGFVWLDHGGRLVGNVAVQRSGRRMEWLIANLAVHPEFRRHGIAQALTRAAMDLAREHGGRTIILQVDADNQAAAQLYAGLGFHRETGRTVWTRPPGRPPEGAASRLKLRPRAAGEWQAHYALASLARPEGIAWNQSMTPATFRTSPVEWLDRFLSGQREEHWLALAVTREDFLAGALSLLTNYRGHDQLTLLVHPDFRGQVERPLLSHGLRRLGRRPWSAQLEYRASDAAAEAVFKDLGFVPGRTLVWMKAKL